MQIANKSRASGRLRRIFSLRFLIARESQKSGMKKATTMVIKKKNKTFAVATKTTRKPSTAGNASLAPRKMSAWAGFRYPASMSLRISSGSGFGVISLRIAAKGFATKSVLTTERHDRPSVSSALARASRVTCSKRAVCADDRGSIRRNRSEEHTFELQSQSHISYAVFCLKKKKQRRYRQASPLLGRTRRMSAANQLD